MQSKTDRSAGRHRTAGRQRTAARQRTKGWGGESVSVARAVALLLTLASILVCLARAQPAPGNDPVQYGPYNGTFLAGGAGLRTPVRDPEDPLLHPHSPWTLSAWFKTPEAIAGREFLAGLGDITSEYPRMLALAPGKVSLWMGDGNELAGAARLAPGEWHLVSASFDGAQVRLFCDGVRVATGTLTLGSATPVLQMAPPLLIPAQAGHFGGQIAGFTVLRRGLSDAEEQQMERTPPDFAVLQYEEGSKPWPVQTRGQAGYRGPQDPETVPMSRAPYSRPAAIKRAPSGESLHASRPGEWTFADNWTLREAPKVAGDAATLAGASFAGADWMRATVPGTVLTTMVDDGIYPDPDYGLNNLAIPESLNRQDYWYRNLFNVPAAMRSALGDGRHHVVLTFEGINYQAEIWLNGSRLGSMKGAFRRGCYDVTALLKPGEGNALAVRISPPPHPGIPQEQSMLGGPGENGGLMELDGPTFLATEGWDWIPAIRDRDSGIWQPVTLTLTGELRLGDTQVLTSFKKHDTAQAEVELRVPVNNLTDKPLQAAVKASFGEITVRKMITVRPGETTVTLTPAEFPQLSLRHPRLWWPNGYGKPELYLVHIEVSAGTEIADSRDLHFGVREISYELSLLDSTGHLRRVEFTPGAAPDAPRPIVDVSHEGMREIPSADANALGVPEKERDEYQYHTVVSSLAAGAEHSPAIEASDDLKTAPYLVIKVNGIRIAARGGNWGMDDARKRVSREHLEPFFRLNRDANLNIIRNWVGQSTEETFYDLADEYGMLVWNDFWESTQNYNIEAEDPQLFLENAADVIEHFRNHPSIALWCGRNEGVPQPILNQGLERLVRTLDGSRFYSPSSNQINLQQSGPYSYQDPAHYYNALNRGFSVETGTPSMSTLESFESTVPKPDQWPIDDVWAYHDWHESGNGKVAPFMAELEAEFGAPTSLPDFERKAQMLNYVDYRAIFEGMNANLWSPNSGRMLWMTQPAWPSTMWQILSSDYDTQASFYGSKKACEPLHVQLNLATQWVDLVNTTPERRAGLTVSAKVYSLANVLLFETSAGKSVDADQTAPAFALNLAPYLAKGMVLVELRVLDASQATLSKNLYWLGGSSAQYRQLTRLAPAPMRVTAVMATAGDETRITLQLTNPGGVPSLQNKLTLLGEDNARILPAYYSDNYVSLLPGETQAIQILFPADPARKRARIGLRGWNAEAQTIEVKFGDKP